MVVVYKKQVRPAFVREGLYYVCYISERESNVRYHMLCSKFEERGFQEFYIL